MSPIHALVTPLYWAVQSVLAGHPSAPQTANFSDFIKALEELGFTQRAGVASKIVEMDPPAGWVPQTGPLRLSRPNVGNAWYPYEHVDVRMELEERFGITGSSFIELPNDAIPNERGYAIPTRKGN
ncbi:uncharacterized protein TRAVEDRAFT_52880 [Trametes versicolor FP-101664 SS1]|uniref:uncharacterized protein n=1 Tax=Trametes versicolor (strain FP-101664) TaxID=717944 RepID=UPI0004621BF7|nr:uncharacterized protein TRAVEDRAFT_52880 [Trametes versicolor FP-101664 SS1]EIW53757.1 hypothetical protein TRAVEDRAFT_52880 [Trametes versicolor FP-101664 SS1]